MSMYKKFGGIRLRLATGLTAAMAICGVVLAVHLTPAASFNPSSVTQTVPAHLVLTGFSAGTYYLTPNDRELENNDSEGWLKDEDQSGTGAEEDPYTFDENTMAIEVSLGTGTNDIHIFTDVVDEEDGDEDQKDTSIQVRSGSPTGTVVATGNLVIFEQ